MREWAKVVGLATLVVLFVTGLATACGGGEEEGAERTPTTTEETTLVTEEGTPLRDEGVMPPRDLPGKGAI